MDEEYYSEVKRVFKKWASFYDVVDIFISGVREKVAAAVGDKEGLKVLDVATGTGSQAFALARRRHDVTGIDLSEDMLSVANRKNRYESVKLAVADAANMPFTDATFDISCISFGLHEMPLSIGERVLKEIVRVTRAGGVVIVVDYDLPRNRLSRFLIYHFVGTYETRYYREFIQSDLDAVLRKAGIEIKEQVRILHGVARIIKGIRV